MRYIRKGIREQVKLGNMNKQAVIQNTFDVVPVKEDTEIETKSGIALITAGNYIMTNPDGTIQGITPQDLEYQYDKE